MNRPLISTTKTSTDIAIVNIEINSDRLQEEIETLANFSEVSAPAVTRVLFSDEDVAARNFLRDRCREAGLEIREDPIGNMFATWPGTDRSLGAVGTGSHTDAIPNAGKYDGVVGVLGGLEAIRALKESGYQPRHDITLIPFTAEEPTRFNAGCLGSRMMCGAVTPEKALSLMDKEGVCLDEWRNRAGYSGDLAEVQCRESDFSAFVELHIEQGPELEEAKEDIGAVTAIAAPAGYGLRILGEGGHAGAVLMPKRQDAFMGAAEIALALETLAKNSGSPDTVATIGVVEVLPGAINGIPNETRLEIDVRDISLESRDKVLEDFRAKVTEICERRQLRQVWTEFNCDPPATCAPHIVDAVETASAEFGLKCRRMVSRAYHDAVFMARLAPTAMIFIPCYKGYSHRPDEYSSPEEIANGVKVLAHTLKTLAG